MNLKRRYIFGPVPSRRLGLSLGIDIVPPKTCTQDCIYCQLGTTALTTTERKPWVPAADVLAEVAAVLEEGVRTDHITISGSGEPTLNSELGRIIDGIKAVTAVPVAIITNGTLLSDPIVRGDCAKADVVLPSLDAGDEETFRVINRPHPSVTFGTFLDGLCAFRSEYKGPIWLEVFIIEGVNTSAEQIGKLRECIGRIRPDKVQLNTAVRPTAEKGVTAASPARLAEIARLLGQNAEVIADFRSAGVAGLSSGTEDILAMLRRRPCSLEDICSATGMRMLEACKHVELLENEELIGREIRGGVLFYFAK